MGRKCEEEFLRQKEHTVQRSRARKSWLAVSGELQLVPWGREHEGLRGER